MRPPESHRNYHFRDLHVCILDTKTQFTTNIYYTAYVTSFSASFVAIKRKRPYTIWHNTHVPGMFICRRLKKHFVPLFIFAYCVITAGLFYIHFVSPFQPVQHPASRSLEQAGNRIKAMASSSSFVWPCVSHIKTPKTHKHAGTPAQYEAMRKDMYVYTGQETGATGHYMRELYAPVRACARLHDAKRSHAPDRTCHCVRAGSW